MRSIWFPLILLGFTASGQISLEKLRGPMERGKWLKAEQSIRKALVKDSLNPEARYLLSLYYFNADHPSFNLDSAYAYSQSSRRSFQLSTPRDRERLKRVPLDSTVLTRLKTKIDSVAFEKAKQVNTEGGYQYFINHNTTASQLSAAIELRDEVAFLEALKVNTWNSFQNFITRHPSSHRKGEAQKRFDKLLYEDKTKDQRLSSYIRFHQQYPESPYRGLTEKTIFEVSTASGSPQSFQHFIERYPSSKWSRVAKNILYEFRTAEREESFGDTWMTDSLRQAEKLNKSYWVPVIKSGLYGFMDEHGAEVVAPQFEDIPDDYLCGDVNDRFLITSRGLLARNGSVVWRGNTQSAKDIGLGFILLSTDSGRQVLHESGFKIGTAGIEDAQLIVNRFIGIQKNKKWAVYSLIGKGLLPFLYEEITAFDSLILLTKNGKRILTTRERLGRVADKVELKEDFVFDDMRKWGAQHYWVRNGVLEGVMSVNLNFIVPLDRQTLRKTSFGFLSGKGDDLFVKGIQKLENKPYKSVQEQGGWVRMQTGEGRHLLYDKGFGWLFEGDSSWFQGQLAFLQSGDSVKAFLPSGQKLSFARNSPFQFKEYRDSSAWLVLEEKKKKAVYDAASGVKLFTLEFDQIEAVSPDILLVTRMNKRGLLTEEGKVLVPIEYDAIVASGARYFSLLKEKKFGWYDARANLLIKPMFDRNIKSYNSRFWLAYKDKGYGFIFPDGKPVGAFEWEEIQYWNDSVAWVKKNFQWRLLDIGSQKVKLDRVRSFSVVRDSPQEKIFKVRKDNAFGVISNRHGIIVPLQYSDVVNLGSQEIPLYFTERHIEEAGISVVVYYDSHGKIIRKQAMETEEFERIYCDN